MSCGPGSGPPASLGVLGSPWARPLALGSLVVTCDPLAAPDATGRQRLPGVLWSPPHKPQGGSSSALTSGTQPGNQLGHPYNMDSALRGLDLLEQGRLCPGTTGLGGSSRVPGLWFPQLPPPLCLQMGRRSSAPRVPSRACGPGCASTATHRAAPRALHGAQLRGRAPEPRAASVVLTPAVLVRVWGTGRHSGTSVLSRKWSPAGAAPPRPMQRPSAGHAQGCPL